jgi:3-oxoacyl-[acyl-carrier protein] reductase
MTEEQEQPVALVTGSRKGLGRYLAERLVESGYRVVGCSREEAEGFDGYRHVLCDVSREEDVLRLFHVIRDEYGGRLDATVNNAGVASMNHILLTPTRTLDKIFGINTRGTFMVSAESAKLMRRRKFGRIVNMTSIAVPLVLEGESVYGAMKAAVESFTRSFARELAADGITVNCVGPGPVDTDMLRGVPKEKLQALLDRLAIKKMGTPADVWNVVQFFLRAESTQVTGQVLYLGGA